MTYNNMTLDEINAAIASLEAEKAEFNQMVLDDPLAFDFDESSSARREYTKQIRELKNLRKVLEKPEEESIFANIEEKLDAGYFVEYDSFYSDDEESDEDITTIDTQATEVLDLPALPIASEPEPETQPVSDTDWLEDWYNEIPEPESESDTDTDTDTQSDSEWLDDWYNQLPEDRIKFKLSFASFLLYLVWLLRSIWNNYRSPCTYQLL